MKLKRKKFLKISCISIFGLGFTGLMTGVSKSWNNLIIANIGGSSAVLSLMNSFANSYKKVDIVASPGGSGAGINHILQGTKEIGMSSKNPGIIVKGSNGEIIETNQAKIWRDKRAKTITIAWDGMGLIYKPSKPSYIFNSNILDLSDESMGKIYAAFSGIERMQLSDLGIENDYSIVVPYARNGGSTTSGTADAFFNDSHLNYENSEFWLDLKDEQRNDIKRILKFGDYEGNVLQTAESNSQAWNRVKNAQPGAMTYLSAGYILNNEAEIKKNGFEIATYNKKELSAETITNGYNWFRPFNIMFSIKLIENNEHIKNMIEWFISEEAKEIIEKDKYLSLTEKQINTMIGEYDKNLFARSDWDLKYSGAKWKDS